MNRENNNIRLHKNIFLIVVITSIIITFYLASVLSGSVDRYMYLLPMSYVIIILIFSRIFLKPTYQYGILFYSAQFFIFIRFVITPLTTVLATNEFLPGPTPTIDDKNLAIMLMIYELIFVFFGISLSMLRASKKIKIKKHINLDLFKNKFIVYAFTIMFFVILLGFPRYLIPNIGTIGSPSNVQTQEVSGFIEISSLVFKCLSFLVAMSLINNKKNNNKLSIFLSSFLSLLLFLILLIDTTRWTILFMGLSAFFIIYKIHFKYRKFLTISIFFILIVFIIYTSMFKFWWVVEDSSNPIMDIIYHMSNQFQSYFSGPHQVAQSTNLKNVFSSSISVETFLNDFLGSVPRLANYINQSNRINIYFNLYNYRNDATLIMPLIGIGYTYFGFIFSPIFTFFVQWLIIQIDFKIQFESRLEFVFIYLYLGLRLSMSMGFHTQSLFTSFITPTFPLLVIFLLNRKFYFKKKKDVMVV